jgi:arylsulfatase A-like enzyme
MERLVENPAQLTLRAFASPTPRAGTPAAPTYHWTAEQLQSDWTRSMEKRVVTLRSPRLDYSSLDEIHSVVISLSAASAIRNFSLHWSDGTELTPLVLGRNHRALRAGTDSDLIVLGQDIAGTQELDPVAGYPAPRYFFLRFEFGKADALPFESIQILSQSALLALEPHGLTRHDAQGHLRDALYTAIPGEISYRTSLSLPPSDLAFGVRSLLRGTTVRYTLQAGDARTATPFFDQTLQEDGAWHDFRVPLPLASGETTITFRAESSAPGNTAYWANPRIIPKEQAQARKTNVILFLADALRADRLGFYGYEKPVSPFLDQLAESGVVFLNSYSAASWTKPSAASLLTSLYPQTHGVGLRSNTDALPATVHTLQEHLRANGYVSAHLSANPLGSTLSGLDRGFDSTFTPRFFEAAKDRAPKIRSDALVDRTLAWIDEHQGEPFFLYIHAMDTHTPYLARVAADSAAADNAAARYDAEVRFSDTQIRRLHEHLAARGLADRTLFVFTSDHGEAFGEHGQAGHGVSVYQEEIRVPLLMAHRGSLQPERVEEAVTLIDVMPAILGHLRMPLEATAQGVNILSAQERRRDRLIVAGKYTFPEANPSEREVLAAMQSNWKLIARMPLSAEAPILELYDLAADPLERNNLAAAQPERTSGMYAGLLRFLAEQEKSRGEFAGSHEAENARPGAEAGPRPRTLPQDMLEQLRSLGYVK